jgi:predicted flap endonuclease-1-like 5' DNA nuclease
MRNIARLFPSSLVGVLAGTSTALAMLLLAPGEAQASHYAIADVPTLIGSAQAEKLKKAGIATTEDLLSRAAKLKDRKALSKAAGIPGNALDNLARRCDLLRIKGIGPEMVLLLEASGVKTAADLAMKEPGALEAAASKANKQKKITDKPPTGPQFQDWIEQAKKLPLVLEAK